MLEVDEQRHRAPGILLLGGHESLVVCKSSAHKVIDQLRPVGSTALQGEDGLGAAPGRQAVTLLPVPDLPAGQGQGALSHTGAGHHKTRPLVPQPAAGHEASDLTAQQRQTCISPRMYAVACQTGA